MLFFEAEGQGSKTGEVLLFSNVIMTDRTLKSEAITNILYNIDYIILPIQCSIEGP